MTYDKEFLAGFRSKRYISCEILGFISFEKPLGDVFELNERRHMQSTYGGCHGDRFKTYCGIND
jgi:hypothetical protein